MIIKTKIGLKMSIIIALLLCYGPVVRAGQREITFPLREGRLIANPPAHAFAHDGTIGFTVIVDENGLSKHLFSYSLIEAKAVDELNLTSEFGVDNFVFLKAHSKSGLLVAYGHESQTIEKVVAIASDQAGHLSKLWAVSYPSTGPDRPDVTFNSEGSRVYVVYNALEPKVALLRAEDGVAIANISLPEQAGNRRGVSIFFDESRNKAVVETGNQVYIFASGTDRLVIESMMPSVCGIGLGIIQGGRFLVSYGGYILPQGDSGGRNTFCSYDLERKVSNTLDLKGRFIPSVMSLTFHPSTGGLLVPYSLRVKQKSNSSFTLIPGRSKQIDILNVNAEGSLVNSTDVKLPGKSEGSPEPNRILEFNQAVFSMTGALGFVSSGNGRLFTFDTLTGEIVNDQLIDSKSLSYIHLIEPLNVIVGIATSGLVLIDVSTTPLVTSIDVKSGRTIIKGVNFLSGARVQMNGEDLGVVDRALDDPGREITIKRGKKDLPQGQEITVVVVNRDGLVSNPIKFRL